MPYTPSLSPKRPSDDPNGYIKWLLMLGVKFEEYPFFNEQFRNLLLDRNMIYRMPGSDASKYTPFTEETDPLPESITEKTVMVVDIERFEFITANLRVGGSPQLVFGVRTRDGELLYLTEYDAERIYSGRMGDGRNLEDFLTYIARCQKDKFYKGGFIWPQPISHELSDSLHPMKANFNSHSPSIIAERILTELKLPFLVDGVVVNIKTSKADISIPELEVSVAAEIAELRKINPNYGVLKF